MRLVACRARHVWIQLRHLYLDHVGHRVPRWLSQCVLLTSTIAAVTVSGALLLVRRQFPGMVLIASSAAGFGISVAMAAQMPSPYLFTAVLFLVGLAALTVMSASNSMVQIGTERAMRGRVLALRIALGVCQ